MPSCLSNLKARQWPKINLNLYTIYELVRHHGWTRRTPSRLVKNACLMHSFPEMANTSPIVSLTSFFAQMYRKGGTPRDYLLIDTYPSFGSVCHVSIRSHLSSAPFSDSGYSMLQIWPAALKFCPQSAGLPPTSPCRRTWGDNSVEGGSKSDVVSDVKLTCRRKSAPI